MVYMKFSPTWCRLIDRDTTGPVLVLCSEEGEGGTTWPTRVTWFEVVGTERKATSSVSTFLTRRTDPGLAGTRTSRVTIHQL